MSEIENTDEFSRPVGSVAEAFGELGDRLDNATVERLFGRLVDLLPKRNDPTQSFDFAQALWALGRNLRGERAVRAADRIVTAIERIEEQYVVDQLSFGLLALSGNVAPEAGRALSRRILARAALGEGPEILGALVFSLGALGEGLSPEHALRGARLVVNEMERVEKDGVQRTLCRGLGTVGGRVDAKSARTLLTAVLDRLRGQSRSPCGWSGALGRKESLPQLVEALKWPSLLEDDRNMIMTVIAGIQDEDPAQFGRYDEKGAYRAFRADLWKFIAWAEGQTYADGTPFDLTTSPENPFRE